jgi:hypothetical protein
MKSPKNIAVDVGWTLKGVRKDNDRHKTAPDSFRVIRHLVNQGHNVVLISKVNSRQKEEVEQWLENVDFFNKTGVRPENLFFCFERKDKSIFVKALDIDIMIDDRAEVMAHLPSRVTKFLLNPEEDDLDRHRATLVGTLIVQDWLEIERVLWERGIYEP